MSAEHSRDPLLPLCRKKCIALEHTDGIRREKQLFLSSDAVKLIERRDNFRQRNREVRHGFIYTRTAPDGLENVTDRGIVTGENITLSSHTLFRAGDNSCRNIPHIHKVIAAPDGNRQLPRKEGQEQLRNTSSRRIARPDYAGGKHNACVKRSLCRIKNCVCCHRFAFGVIADEPVRIKRIGFSVNFDALRFSASACTELT